MKCGKCEALLWNTPPGKCPKCQAPFGVRDYRYIWHSVKFRCPKCNDVLPTRDLDEKGHPSVLHMNCMGCGEIVHFDNVLIEPKEGTQPMMPEAPAHWWERIVVSTQGMNWADRFTYVFKRPEEVIKETPEDEHWLFSAVYAGIVLTCVLFLAFIPLMCAGVFYEQGWIFFVMPFMYAAMIYGFVAFWAVGSHLIMMATGPTKGFGRTVQAVCLGAPFASFTILSCCPVFFYAGWGLWVVATCRMLIVGHEVSTWRGYLAGFIVPALGMVGTIFMMVRLANQT